VCLRVFVCICVCLYGVAVSEYVCKHTPYMTRKRTPSGTHDHFVLLYIILFLPVCVCKVSLSPSV